MDVPREQGLNALFDALGGAGLGVTSLRNKANRLEELFVRLIGGGIFFCGMLVMATCLPDQNARPPPMAIATVISR